MKQSLQNRDGNTIVTQIEQGSDGQKLVFVMHGLGGSKDESHIRTIAGSFASEAYTVVTWDAVHTPGESTGGAYEDATITNYLADLEDVIEWSKSQSWFTERFVLTGHSFGGICVTLYAQQHPENVSALAPISTVISGSLSFETKADILADWKSSGIRIDLATKTRPEKRLKWANMEDRLRYDILRNVDMLAMPVLMIVGENDIATPPKHQKILYDVLPSRKEMHIIAGAPHTFASKQELKELGELFNNWIRTLE